MSQIMNFDLIEDQIKKYPPTRYMGSKNKLLKAIWDATKGFEFNTVLDLFSGSGVVGYMFKCAGKKVLSNDYMAMSATFSKALIENNTTMLTPEEVDLLLRYDGDNDHFVESVFANIYFSDDDNAFIDSMRKKIACLEDDYKQAIAMTALIRACMKKRPRGIFTYTGNRYDDGRQDLKKSFEQQFVEAVEIINAAIFDNGQENESFWHDSLALDGITPDLVYIDPPYFTPKSDNEYVRRYHFVEGLARDWKGVEIQQNTITKKFRSYPTPFSTLDGTRTAFHTLFQKYQSSVLVISYSSNSLPEQDEMLEILRKYKENVQVIPIDYTYTFGTTKNVKRNEVQEYLFVAY